MLTLSKTAVYLSQCCGVDVVEDHKTNPRDHHDPVAIYTCSSCKEECDVFEDKPEYHFGDLEDEEF